MEKFKQFEPGTKASMLCALMDIQDALTQSDPPRPYCKLTLIDQAGDKQLVNLWGATRELMERRDFVSGKVYLFQIQCKPYNGNKTFAVKDLNEISKPEEEVSVEKFLPSVAPDAEAMYKSILLMVEKGCSPMINNLIYKIYEDYYDQLLYWSAATTHHHNYRSGLLWHMKTMTESAYLITQGSRYRTLNRSLVIAGCALHDIGKIVELETNSLGVAKYTESGTLFGHLLLGYNIVRDYAIRMGLQDEEEIKHLLHIIISHHANQEWGAIKQPATREANLVAMIDYMDARDEEYDAEYRKLEPGEMMEGKSRSLDLTVVKPLFD